MILKNELNYIANLLNSNLQKKINGNINFKVKEVGHSYSSFIENTVKEILIENKAIIKDSENIRGMADFSIVINGKEIPVNVKFGYNSLGNPNIVSMKRILDFFDNDLEKNYIIIKVVFDKQKKMFFNYTFDFIDYVEYYSFDMGTGQIMLKAKDFLEKRVYKKGDSLLVMLEIIKTYNKNVFLNIESQMKNVKNIREKNLLLLKIVYISQGIKHICLKEKQLNAVCKQFK